MFVVMKLQDFEFDQTSPLKFPFPVEVDAGNMVGYLPVYASADEALADFPGAKLMAIHEIADKK